MSGYGVIHRVTVYSGASSSTVLFRLHSQAGLENPYLYPPDLTPRRIEVPECTASPGQLRFRALDPRQTPGDQTDRLLTSYLGDSEGRSALRSSRVEYDVSDDGGATYQREYTGTVSSVKADDKNTFRFTVGDLQADQLNEIFDGTVPGVTWAAPPILLPMGVLHDEDATDADFRFGDQPTRDPVQCIFEEGEDNPRRGVFTTINLTPETRLSDALTELSEFTRKDTAAGRSYAADIRVRFRADIGNTYTDHSVGALQEHQNMLRLRTIAADGDKVKLVSAVELSGDDLLPADNTIGRYYVYSTAPPRNDAPLHIGVGTSLSGVHWATLVSGIAGGVFGGTGFPIHAGRFQTLASDDTQPLLRFRVRKGPVGAQDWLADHVWRVVGYAPATTASGELYPVSYDPPSALPSLTFSRNNTLSAQWSQSRTGKINRVRFETIRERAIPLTRSDDNGKTVVELDRAAEPVDLIEEHLGDRIITTRDAGAKQGTFEVKAQGLRPPNNTDQLDKVRAFADQRTEIILDRFQDGPQTAVIVARRQDATRGAMVGDHAIVDVPWLPDLQTKKRGGTRVMLIVSKGVNPDGTYTFELLDNGPEQFVDAPTIDTVAQNSNDRRHAVDVTVTPPGTPDRAEIQVATTLSGASTPAAGSELWRYQASISGTAQQTVTLGSQPSRRQIHVRAIGRGPGKLPSAFVTNAGVVTAAIPQPTNLTVTASGTQLITTWSGVAVTTTYGVRPMLDGADFTSRPLPAGSTRFTFTELDPQTSYTVGVRFVDDFGGDSATTSETATTSGVQQLAAPRGLVILQGRGDVDLGMPRNPEFGTGIELAIQHVEPYSSVILQHDDNAAFPSPTTLSGVGTERIRISFPLDDDDRYFRAASARTGWTTSEWSETVSAKPVALLETARKNDGFPGGSAFLTRGDGDEWVLNVNTSDADTDVFHYVVGVSGYVEPTTASSGILRSQMPYSATTGLTPISGYRTGYLWGKFRSNVKGFGQEVKHSLFLPAENLDLRILGHHFVPTSGANTMQWRINLSLGDDVRSVKQEVFYSFWTTVADKYQAVPREQVYVHEIDADGTITVTEADGSATEFTRDDTIIDLKLTPFDDTAAEGTAGTTQTIDGPNPANAVAGVRAIMTATPADRAFGEMIEFGDDQTGDGVFAVSQGTYGPRVKVRDAYSVGTLSGSWTPNYLNGAVQEATLGETLTLNTPANMGTGRSMTILVTTAGNAMSFGTGYYGDAELDIATLSGQSAISFVKATGSIFLVGALRAIRQL